ncbi:MAG TPA: pyridoxal-dependent decarboxylase [Bryobacteraceae bacterium]|nr:pyridoxal-dependent decarboxylase [Bryobacteraceae bacterium]
MSDDSRLRDQTKKLGAWFLGPKAENAETEEKLISFILQDYFHWRRNYYPSDEIVIRQSMRREQADWNDELAQKIAEMLAGLRRHFPFYSPRYLAHMMSDQTLPSVLGYFAGLLYNPNNVTPEAAPVTERWEFDVGRDILEMLGYKAPPAPPGVHVARSEFGWAHVTSGGTVANIEALWAARNAAYFPLAVHRIASELRLPLDVTLPDQSACNLADLPQGQCLSLAPGEILHLLPRLLAAIQQRLDVPQQVAIQKTPELLAASGFSLAHSGAAACYAVRPPAIFVSATKHYSIYKAADLLGIGRENVILVDVDSLFRMHVGDLEAKIRQAIARGLLPLAVIATVGTTEEGAVDPVHEVLDLRHELEAELRTSFWLHVDAAWAGYLRSLFPAGAAVPPTPPQSLDEHIETVRRFVSCELDLSGGAYSRTLQIQWGAKDVLSAFLAFARADSITVDPHKMGYVPYPCGVVAFRNDRVRQFLAEAAPYLESAAKGGEEAADHAPPTAIGPYILEGSKPGAAVAGVWLSHRMIPLNRDGHGEIVRASLLAARELYERLVHWEHWAKANGVEAAFEFHALTPEPPDTNIVCFLVKEKPAGSLARMNELNRWIYQRFTIESEYSQGEYSYSQPFFLSHTVIQYPGYSPTSVGGLLQRLAIEASDYFGQGLFVLRATVMSPYIVLAEESGRSGRPYLAQFVERLAAKAEEGIAALAKSGPDTPRPQPAGSAEP